MNVIEQIRESMHLKSNQELKHLQETMRNQLITIHDQPIDNPQQQAMDLQEALSMIKMELERRTREGIRDYATKKPSRKIIPEKGKANTAKKARKTSKERTLLVIAGILIIYLLIRKK